MNTIEEVKKYMARTIGVCGGILVVVFVICICIGTIFLVGKGCYAVIKPSYSHSNPYTEWEAKRRSQMPAAAPIIPPSDYIKWYGGVAAIIGLCGFLLYYNSRKKKGVNDVE